MNSSYTSSQSKQIQIHLIDIENQSQKDDKSSSGINNSPLFITLLSFKVIFIWSIRTPLLIFVCKITLL